MVLAAASQASCSALVARTPITAVLSACAMRYGQHATRCILFLPASLHERFHRTDVLLVWRSASASNDMAEGA